MDLKKNIAVLESAIQDPSKGLPEEIFLLVSRITPLVNVDLLIRNDRRQSLLTWRQDGYWEPGWHVPGGIIRYREKIADRLIAVAQSELGAEIDFDPVPLAMTEMISGKNGDRGHFISLLYRCKLVTEPDERLRCTGVPKKDEWLWHDGCPDKLITPHNVYRKYLEKDAADDGFIFMTVEK